jgi:hypothetical protein
MTAVTALGCDISGWAGVSLFGMEVAPESWPLVSPRAGAAASTASCGHGSLSFASLGGCVRAIVVPGGRRSRLPGEQCQVAGDGRDCPGG